MITEPLAAQLHYYLEYFPLQRRTLGFHVGKASSVPLCSTNIFQLSGKEICALAAVRWDSKSKCLVLNWLMSPSLWLLRDCFVAPAWKRSKHKAKPQHSLNSFTALSSARTWTEVVDFFFFFFLQGWHRTSFFISMVGQKMSLHHLAQHFYALKQQKIVTVLHKPMDTRACFLFLSWVKQ